MAYANPKPSGFSAWWGNDYITAAAGSYTLTGTTVSFRNSHAVIASALSTPYLLVPPATPVLLTYRRKMVATTPATYALVAPATPVTLRHALKIAAATPVTPYLLTGAATTNVLHKWKLDATTPGAYSYTGQPATLRFTRTLAASPATYSYTGSDVGLTKLRQFTLPAAPPAMR